MSSSSVLFAVDISGSTGGNGQYWEAVKEVYSKYKTNTLTIFGWDDKDHLMSNQELTEIIKRRQGFGLTEPKVVANFMKAQKFSEVVLITDGQIPHSSVLSCVDALANCSAPEQINCYIINPHIDNGSVCAPFLQLIDNSRLFLGYEVQKPAISIKNPQLASIDNLEQFFEKYEDIFNFISVKNLGRNNIEHRNEILALQDRLMKQTTNIEAPPEIVSLNTHLDTQQLTEAKEMAQRVIKEYSTRGAEVVKELRAKFQKLLLACQQEGIYDIHNVQKRYERANQVEQPEVELKPEIENTSELSRNYQEIFECPVSLNRAEPVLMINDDTTPVLGSLPVKLQETIIDCPLAMCHQSADGLISKLDHPLGLWAYQNLDIDRNGVKTSPMTRKNIRLALTLQNSPDHRKAGNYVLYQLFTEGKAVGQPDLWFVVLWYFIRHEPRFEYLRSNTGFMAKLTSHLKYRLTNFETYLGLINQPESVLYRAPIATALWYCLHCYEFNLGAGDRSRAITFYYQPAVEALQELGYPLNSNLEADHNVIKTLITLFKIGDANELRWYEHLLKSLIQNHYWLTQAPTLKACQEKRRYQADKKIMDLNNYYVPCLLLDGESTDFSAWQRLPKWFQALGAQHCLKLYQLRTKFDNQPLKDVSWSEVQEALTKSDQKSVWEYCYSRDPQNVRWMSYVAPICPATLRHYSHDLITSETWQEASEKTYGSLDKQIWCGALLHSYIRQRNQFPTLNDLNDFLLFCYRKQLFCARKFSTLPYHSLTMVKTYFQELSNALQQFTKWSKATIDVENYLKIYDKSVSKTWREREELAYLQSEH